MALFGIAGCSPQSPTEPSPSPAPPVTEASAPLAAASEPPRDAAPPAAASASATTTVRPRLPLPPAAAVHSQQELRHQAALRIVAANPDITYSGVPPEPLLAIPVLRIELNADGSVRRIEVLRPPRHALDTIQLAKDAVRRAAPFGDVSRMPKPWKFTETFLFDDDRHFKPRSLD